MVTRTFSTEEWPVWPTAGASSRASERCVGRRPYGRGFVTSNLLTRCARDRRLRSTRTKTPPLGRTC